MNQQNRASVFRALKNDQCRTCGNQKRPMVTFRRVQAVRKSEICIARLEGKNFAITEMHSWRGKGYMRR